MRPELTQIELIEKYLNGTMNEADRLSFEQQMNLNPELASAVNTQQLMVQAVERKALLATVQANAPTVSGMSSPLKNFKWPIIFSMAIIGVFTAWQLWGTGNINSDTETTKENNTKVQQTAARENNEEVMAEESVADLAPDAKHTSWVKTSRRQFGGLETWIAPDVQRVKIDGTKSELVECKEGTVILIPKGAFQDSKGKTVSEEIDLEVIEALTMDKFVSYNLATMSDGHALQSGGMLYLQAKRGNEVLSVKPGKSVHIEIPTDEFDPEMKVWDGVANGKGDLNWENPREIERYLVSVAIESLDFLPEGFREEVSSTLPYRSYTKSSTSLEDSLYYAISGFCESTDEVEEMTIEPVTASDVAIFSGTTREVRPPLRLKRRNGAISEGDAGSVKFTNLPEGITYTAELRTGKANYTYQIENDEVLDVPNFGPLSVKITSKSCGDYITSVNLMEDKMTIIDCGSIICADEQVQSKAVEESVAANTCYINPASIYAIHQKKYENTFIATREFEERLQALHKVRNAQALLELYINQLSKNLYEIDQQVAGKVSEPHKSVFNNFAAEKLTNVQPNGQEFEKLSNYYSTQLMAKQREEKKKRDVYTQKSVQELQALQNELSQLRTEYLKKRNQAQRGSNHPASSKSNKLANTDWSKRIARVVNARPQVGQQASYKVSWYGTAWTNIDKYLKTLSAGERIVAMNAPEEKGGTIYQSIASLRTMVILNKTEKGYEAHFPKNPSAVFRNSVGIGVSRKSNDTYALCSVTYDPYTTTEVTLSDWQMYNESEFKKRLTELYPNSIRILRGYKEEDERLRKAIEQRKRAEEEQKKRQEELKRIEKKYQEESAEIRKEQVRIQKQQREEVMYMQNLIDFINPCNKSEIANGYQTVAIDPITETPDIEASFPGGSAALMQFINDNVQYPQDALEKRISGTIYTELLVDTKGAIDFIDILDSQIELRSLEEEAKRLVLTMPNWIPAQLNGSDISSRVVLPITFSLEN